jgi:hypothetical protein
VRFDANKISLLLFLQFTDDQWLMPRPTLAEPRQHLLETVKRPDLCYPEVEQPPNYPAQYTLVLCITLDEPKERTRKHQD